MCCSSPEAPDYTPMADASEKSAQIMADLGHEQMDFAKQQYNDAKPVYERIVNSQLDTQDELTRQGKDYYDYNTETFRPVEQGLVADANNFNTDAYKERMAAQASADAGRAFGITKNANDRAMRSMGVNPNSGAYQSINARAGLGLAANRANASTQARTSAEDMSWARRMDVTGLGRNLPGASTGAYSAAVNAGNSAGSNEGAPGAALQSGLASGASTIGAGVNSQLSGLGTVLNAQTQWAMDNNSSFLGDLGGLAGAAAGGYRAFRTW